MLKVKRNWLRGKSSIKTFYGHEEAVSCVQFDETRIVAGSAAGTIKVWSLCEASAAASSTMAPHSALRPYLTLAGHSRTIRCLHLDAHLGRLFSGSADHSIKVRRKQLFFTSINRIDLCHTSNISSKGWFIHLFEEKNK
jgi:F-box/WD-40 domain protein 7